MLALPGVGGSVAPTALRIAVFGVRGMGSIFYIAYAQTHAEFADIDGVWRIGALVILLSIVLHGFGAAIAMPAEQDEQRDPPHEAEPDGPGEGVRDGEGGARRSDQAARSVDGGASRANR